jgi:EAL domain-containing protein (putative c-di-GMP-specific phosphodiesterase class I)
MELNEISEELKQMIDNKELQAYYQPQYNIMTGEVIGAEALLRCERNDGTVIPPNELVERLEKTEQILNVDWYIAECVCAFLKKQEELNIERVPIAINFSRLHFWEVDFARKLCILADDYDVPHDMLIVEITETALTGQNQKISFWVSELHEYGFLVAIDNFGSELSSINFVKDISVDILKVDRALLSHNCEIERERVILECVFYFASRMKIPSIVVGVETKEQLSFLKTNGCIMAQGYLFDKPMKEDDFLKLMSDKQGHEAQKESLFSMQVTSNVSSILLDVIFQEYPLVILANLTRNSFFMVSYDKFSSTSCSPTGDFDECIKHASLTMCEEDREKFYETFCTKHQLEVYSQGKRSLTMRTSQIGDDGIYRPVEIKNFFVKEEGIDDILVVSLSHNIEE